jgi:hypothetical protein
LPRKSKHRGVLNGCRGLLLSSRRDHDVVLGRGLLLQLLSCSEAELVLGVTLGLLALSLLVLGQVSHPADLILLGHFLESALLSSRKSPPAPAQVSEYELGSFVPAALLAGCSDLLEVFFHKKDVC